MSAFSFTMWPLWCGCLFMLIAAAINARSLTTPNYLSLSAAVVGWLLAAIVGTSTLIPTGSGGLLPSVIASIVGLVLLIPFYSHGWLGAGCVKMQAAFGAWVGCALEVTEAVWVVGLATVIGVLFTVIGAGAMIASQRMRPHVEDAAEVYLFPAQITLSVGSVCGVLLASLLGWI